MSQDRSRLDEKPDDPVLIHARRELVMILVAFAVCLVWSVTWCIVAGYHRPPGEPVAKVLGMPSWVFWGVAVPWLAADVFTVWFCFFYMVDDPMGVAGDEGAPEADITNPREDEGRPA